MLLYYELTTLTDLLKLFAPKYIRHHVFGGLHW